MICLEIAARSDSSLATPGSTSTVGGGLEAGVGDLDLEVLEIVGECAGSVGEISAVATSCFPQSCRLEADHPVFPSKLQFVCALAALTFLDFSSHIQGITW